MSIYKKISQMFYNRTFPVEMKKDNEHIEVLGFVFIHQNLMNPYGVRANPLIAYHVYASHGIKRIKFMQLDEFEKRYKEFKILDKEA